MFAEERMADRPVVLVVEDDKEMNQLECELLQIHGMETVQAYSGTEAIDVAARCHTDAVLLDMMLPEMDGFECCRSLRDRSCRDIPIIIVSALDSAETRQQGLDAGADAFFTKPFDPFEVVDTVRMLIDKARRLDGGNNSPAD